MKLETERCHIRNFSAADAGELYEILSDARVMAYIEPVFDKAGTRRFIEAAGLCEPPLVYAVTGKVSGRLIGHVIFHRFESSSYEIGWILTRDVWGQGIASELTAALVQQVRRLGADSCVIECDPKQTASQAIARKSGFTCEGVTDQLIRYRLRLNADKAGSPEGGPAEENHPPEYSNK